MAKQYLKIEKTENTESVWRQIKEYDHALFYGMSDVVLCQTAALTEDEVAELFRECLEARFFSDKKELHYFDGIGIRVEETECETQEKYDDFLLSKYELKEKFGPDWKCISVKEYITYDEDGQLCVKLTRLAGVE